MTLEAWRKVLHVIGGGYKERWPDEEYRIMFLIDVFTYPQNHSPHLPATYGTYHVGLVYLQHRVQPQLGADPCDHGHARRFLTDLARGKYEHNYQIIDRNLLSGTAYSHCLC